MKTQQLVRLLTTLDKVARALFGPRYEDLNDTEQGYCVWWLETRMWTTNAPLPRAIKRQPRMGLRRAA